MRKYKVSDDNTVMLSFGKFSRYYFIKFSKLDETVYYGFLIIKKKK